MSENNKKVVWQKSFEMGLGDVDDQHYLLVDTINKANQILTNNYTLEDLQHITEDLIKYSLAHFETEENLMHIHKYYSKMPQEYNQHIQEHEHFKTKIASIREEIDQGVFVGREEIINFLCQWLVEHTNSTDKRLGKFIDN